MVTTIALLVQIGLIVGGVSLANTALHHSKSGSFAVKRRKEKDRSSKIVQTLSFGTITRGLALDDKMLMFKLDCLKLLQKLQKRNNDTTYSMISHSITKRALAELEKINIIKNFEAVKDKKKNFIGEKIFLGNFKNLIKSPLKKQNTFKMKFQLGDKKITNELIYQLLGDSAEKCKVTYNDDLSIKEIKYNIFSNEKRKNIEKEEPIKTPENSEINNIVTKDLKEKENSINKTAILKDFRAKVERQLDIEKENLEDKKII